MQGSVISGVTERLLPGGEGIVRSLSAVVLVPNTVPGDVLDIRIEDRRRGAWRGSIHRLKSPSEDRIMEPVCSAAQSCGGCALQYVRAEYQAWTKNEWVKDAFVSYLSDQVQFNSIDAVDVKLGTRRRMRWWRGEDSKGTYWGFRGRASHEVVRHDDCVAATPCIRKLHKQLSELPLSGVKSMQVTELTDGMHLVLEGDRFDLPYALPETVGALPIQVWARSERGVSPLTKPVRKLHDRLPAGQEWIEISVGPDDFIQASFLGNTTMVRQVQVWSEGARRIADLFSGIGNLSLPLAAAMNADVIGAEVSTASVVAANSSAQSLGLNARYMQADLFHRFDTAPFTGMDVLILDPPRKGARRVCDALPILLPRKIILISCDIASGKRDAEMIAAHGYRLTALRALDMFPYTGHVETMSLWVL